MSRFGWASFFSKFVVDPADNQFTLQYVTVVGVMMQYISFISAIIYEWVFSISHSTEISKSLNELGLLADKHRECVKSYPYTVCIIFAAMIIEMSSLYILDRVVKSITTDGAFVLEIIYIFLTESLALSTGKLVRTKPIVNISNPSVFPQLSLDITDDFILIFVTVYIPILLKMRPFVQAAFLAEVLKILADFSILIFLNNEDVIAPKKSAVFLDWEPLGEDLTKQLLNLFSKVEFNKDNCRVIFSLEKYINLSSRTIEIPPEALHFYGKDALVGYVAFVLAEIENGTTQTLISATIMSRIAIIVVLSLLVRKALTLEKPLLEIIKAVRIARILEFSLNLLVNIISRRLELACDRFVVDQGLKDNLLEYIKKIDQDPEIEFSSYFTEAMTIFSQRNCLKDRMHTILQLQ
ncbi:uncharacterized protein VICG_01878 [Vittaforma corneae ATCC 50505]|uniref:Uncharacterized protein n=1 Tax=Vittaforma corneae (strain ATCC 50505) TaxID=993615 RepID=L2GKS7_VITCO|nr:uncharacterized protein VICG_01878 [Vittaforma corneae ATCC 50505]ELA41085.1 hypothetical protein VICG_01878 [Vittaforma corneae ATCC 50505]